MCSNVGGIQYRGGYHEYCGDTMSTVGDILSNVGVFSTVGDILSTVGVFSSMGDIMSTVGVILSTVGCSVSWGIS